MNKSGFTLLELFIVILIIGIGTSLLSVRFNVFSYWQEESAIRRLSELISFLHKRAETEGVYFRLDFKYGDICTYKVSQLPTFQILDGANLDGTSRLSSEISSLTMPVYTDENNLMPPEGIPSLGDPVELPNTMCFTDIKTMHGEGNSGNPDLSYMIFSPQAFTEFAVIHLKSRNSNEITILVNPFTGNSKIYRAYKDFEWSYGKQ